MQSQTLLLLLPLALAGVISVTVDCIVIVHYRSLLHLLLHLMVGELVCFVNSTSCRWYTYRSVVAPADTVTVTSVVV
jgi:hypothetical protein